MDNKVKQDKVNNMVMMTMTQICDIEKKKYKETQNMVFIILCYLHFNLQ